MGWYPREGKSLVRKRKRTDKRGWRIRKSIRPYHAWERQESKRVVAPPLDSEPPHSPWAGVLTANRTEGGKDIEDGVAP